MIDFGLPVDINFLLIELLYNVFKSSDRTVGEIRCLDDLETEYIVIISFAVVSFFDEKSFVLLYDNFQKLEELYQDKA